jgi:hypothetical protein
MKNWPAVKRISAYFRAAIGGYWRLLAAIGGYRVYLRGYA